MPDIESRCLIGIPVAARKVDVHEQTIRRWIKAGRLNAYRVGPTRIKVDVAELEQLVQVVGGGAA